MWALRLRRQRESGILPTLACGVIGKRPEQKCNTLYIVQLTCYPKSWDMPTHNSQFSHLLSLLMLLICESMKGYHTLCFCNFSVHILEGEKLGMNGWVIKTLMQSRPGNEARQLCCNSVWKLKVLCGQIMPGKKKKTSELKQFCKHDVCLGVARMQKQHTFIGSTVKESIR